MRRKTIKTRITKPEYRFGCSRTAGGNWLKTAHDPEACANLIAAAARRAVSSCSRLRLQGKPRGLRADSVLMEYTRDVDAPTRHDPGDDEFNIDTLYLIYICTNELIVRRKGGRHHRLCAHSSSHHAPTAPPPGLM